MPAKRVIMITWDFPPLDGPGTQRILKYCKYLPAYGWQPTVIAGIAPEEHQDEALLRDLPDQFPVERACQPPTRWHRTRTWLTENYLGRVADAASRWFDFPDRHREWAQLFAAAKAEELHRQHPFDLLLTTGYWFSPHLAGLELRDKLDIPWVTYHHRPWATNEILLGELPSWLRKRHAAAERSIIETADATVLAQPMVADEFRHRYPSQADRIFSITNGFDPDDFGRKKGIANCNAIRIVHTGSFSGECSPRRFVEAVGRLTEGKLDMEISFEFIGGTGFSQLPRLGKGISFRETPRVSHDEAIQLQSGADLLLIAFDEKSGLHHIPDKLFEYLAAGHPIVAVVPPDGAAAKIIRACKAGWVCDCNRPAAIAHTLLEACRRVKTGHNVPRQDTTLIRKYAWPALAGELAGIMNELLHGFHHA